MTAKQYSHDDCNTRAFEVLTVLADDPQAPLPSAEQAWVDWYAAHHCAECGRCGDGWRIIALRICARCLIQRLVRVIVRGSSLADPH